MEGRLGLTRGRLLRRTCRRRRRKRRIVSAFLEGGDCGRGSRGCIPNRVNDKKDVTCMPNLVPVVVGVTNSRPTMVRRLGQVSHLEQTKRYHRSVLIIIY